MRTEKSRNDSEFQTGGTSKNIRSFNKMKNKNRLQTKARRREKSFKQTLQNSSVAYTPQRLHTSCSLRQLKKQESVYSVLLALKLHDKLYYSYITFRAFTNFSILQIEITITYVRTVRIKNKAIIVILRAIEPYQIFLYTKTICSFCFCLFKNNHRNNFEKKR